MTPDPLMDLAEEEVELNNDDIAARRILTLSCVLREHRSLSTQYIRQNVYGDIPAEKDDTFYKAFGRDRDRLAKLGTTVARGSDGESWSIECGTAADLSIDDALSVALLCSPLLDNPAFPLHDELRCALGLIYQRFHDVSFPSSGGVRHNDKIVDALNSAFMERHGVRASYTNAAGQAHDVDLAPLGFFVNWDRLYMVAAKVGADGLASFDEDGVRVYRVDRVAKVRMLDKVTYDIPDSIDLESYHRLPFQFGPVTCTGTFLVPQSMEAEVRIATMGRGEFASHGTDLAWSIPIGSVGDAAVWAISQGIRPIAPEELVDAWKNALGEVVARG